MKIIFPKSSYSSLWEEEIIREFLDEVTKWEEQYNKVLQEVKTEVFRYEVQAKKQGLSGLGFVNLSPDLTKILVEQQIYFLTEKRKNLFLSRYPTEKEIILKEIKKYPLGAEGDKKIDELLKQIVIKKYGSLEKYQEVKRLYNIRNGKVYRILKQKLEKNWFKTQTESIKSRTEKFKTAADKVKGKNDKIEKQLNKLKVLAMIKKRRTA